MDMRGRIRMQSVLDFSSRGCVFEWTDDRTSHNVVVDDLANIRIISACKVRLMEHKVRKGLRNILRRKRPRYALRVLFPKVLRSHHLWDIVQVDRMR